MAPLGQPPLLRSDTATPGSRGGCSPSPQARPRALPQPADTRGSSSRAHSLRVPQRTLESTGQLPTASPPLLRPSPEPVLADRSLHLHLAQQAFLVVPNPCHPCSYLHQKTEGPCSHLHQETGRLCSQVHQEVGGCCPGDSGSGVHQRCAGGTHETNCTSSQPALGTWARGRLACPCTSTTTPSDTENRLPDGRLTSGCTPGGTHNKQHTQACARWHTCAHTQAHGG